VAPACAIVPNANESKPELDPKAEAFVTEVVDQEPVVLFALEWCEFSWSVRKLFDLLAIDYKSIDLDSVAYQENSNGGKIRAVLAERTGAVTIPQVFICGKHVGGCTELFDGIRDGSVQTLLAANGIGFDQDKQIDPYQLLPKWVQPRMSA
jgi:cysteine synthase A